MYDLSVNPAYLTVSWHYGWVLNRESPCRRERERARCERQSMAGPGQIARGGHGSPSATRASEAGRSHEPRSQRHPSSLNASDYTVRLSGEIRIDPTGTRRGRRRHHGDSDCHELWTAARRDTGFHFSDTISRLTDKLGV